MHRQRKLSLRQRFLMRFHINSYCLCDHCTRCGCGKWEEHHSHIKYTTPAVLRPFDETRYVIQSLWSSACKGARAVYSS